MAGFKSLPRENDHYMAIVRRAFVDLLILS